MRLCMMPVSIYVSRLDITDLANKIEIHTNLMKLIHFETDTILFVSDILAWVSLSFGSGSRAWTQTQIQTQRNPDSEFISIHFGIEIQNNIKKKILRLGSSRPFFC